MIPARSFLDLTTSFPLYFHCVAIVAVVIQNNIGFMD